MHNALSARPIQHNDIPLIIEYWHTADPDFLRGMGVDPAKMLNKTQWQALLTEQLELPLPLKQFYYTIWEIDGVPVGHCNVNKIKFAEEAFMHLHLWKNVVRQQGAGTQLVRKSLALFFEHLHLKTIYCEPYALNPAPNKTLEKVGFSFIKTCTTVPGMINFEQEVNLWVRCAPPNQDTTTPLLTTPSPTLNP
jgi:RimJ/RimL family protein N-acetyltransferase